MVGKRKSEISPRSTKEFESKKKKDELTQQSQLPQGETPKKNTLPTGEDNQEEEEFMDGVSPIRPPKKTPNKQTKEALVSPPLEIIVLEVYRLNDLPFDSLLCRDDAKIIWVELGRELIELRQISFERHSGRCLQIYYKLRTPTPITEISKRDDFQVEKTREGKGTDIYQVRLPDFKNVESQLGKIVTITAAKTIKLKTSEITDWLELYGTIKSKFR